MVVVMHRSSAVGVPRMLTRSEHLGQPAPGALEHAGSVLTHRELDALALLGAEHHETYTGRVCRRAHYIDEAADLRRRTAAHGEVEHLLGDLGHAFHRGRAAREHEPGGEAVVVAAAHELLLDVL